MGEGKVKNKNKRKANKFNSLSHALYMYLQFCLDFYMQCIAIPSFEFLWSSYVVMK